MQVSVRLSAGLSQAVGRPRLSIELPPPATAATLIDALCAAHPAAAEPLRRAIVAVGGAAVGPDAALPPGQEVALLVPVAGG